MSRLRESARLLLLNSFGDMASTALVICACSGVLLAIPYDVHDPYASLSKLLLANPPGNFIRNIHHWSAQFFLVLTLLHVFDHLVKGTETKLQRYQWILLTASVGVVFYAMLSGFILKGDPDGLQAHRILSSLLDGLPWIGRQMQLSILGNENDLQLVYLNHVATSTLCVFIMVYNHAKRIFPGAFQFFMVLFLCVIIAFFFRAPLHDGYDPVVKGPWYFLGLQEILHWLKQPDWVWGILAVLILLFILIREIRGKASRYLKMTLAAVALCYLFLILTGALFRNGNREFKSIRQAIDDIRPFRNFYPITAYLPDRDVSHSDLCYVNGRAEGCLLCHTGLNGLSASHDPSAIGCVCCHDGDPFSAEKRKAHRNMVLIPGNLRDAGRSCGTGSCHPDIPARVDRSLMTTASGLVSVDRYVFGSSGSLSVQSDIRQIGHDAADQHLRDLCANCHLGMPKTGYGPVTSLSRGGGCNACHLSYSPEALEELTTFRLQPEGFDFRYHPSLDINITDEHCFGCHSRSGRISLGYAGLHETLLDTGDVPPGHLVLEDLRVVSQLEEDVHHKAGMRCVDCHLAVELMGDGSLYLHKEQQVKVRCKGCHREGDKDWTGLDGLDREAGKIARLRYDSSFVRKYYADSESGQFLLNIQPSYTGAAILLRKSDGQPLQLKAPADICSAGTAHERLSCESCHAGWVPQCIGCHNVYHGDAPGMDLLEMREKQGSWVEYVAKFLHDQPVLGVQEGIHGDTVISTFTPGMVLSIALESFPEEKRSEAEFFHRLYAPVSPHTTQAKGRSCISCHLDPLAMGFGRGRLIFHTETGEWEFRNHFAENVRDGLPEDAWTGFLQQRDDQAATRYGMRPFSVQEQQTILLVGTCLTCHDQESDIMQRSLRDFDVLVRQRSEKCIIPVWSRP